MTPAKRSKTSGPAETYHEAVFVKICGITSEEDGLLAVAMGASAVGFVFAPSSRQIAVTRAYDIARRLPPEVLTVGVFRGDDRRKIVETMHKAGLKVAQLHGNETIEDSLWVKERVPQTIKALSAVDPMLARAEEYGADAILLDAVKPGSGETFDWTLTSRVPAGTQLLLAGGLNPGNVATAIAQVRPWGVDVSSGVESAPGKKDPMLVRSFIQAARADIPDLPVQPAPLVAPPVAEEPYDWESAP